MGYDKTLPTNLKNTQEWFGQIIGRPIDLNSRMEMVSPKGKPMEEEAALFIAPSPTLRPFQRIQIYNQQYWWRLLTSLQESFPFVVRMFGYTDFNVKIAFPYLVKYPPDHWTLNLLAKRTNQWAEEDYHSADRELVRHAIAVDWGYNACFLALNQTAFKGAEGSLEDLLSYKLTLPHSLQLFQFPYHLFNFRETFILQEPEYWEHHDFPRLEREKEFYQFVLFRNGKNNVDWKEISTGEYFLLQHFQKGCTIDEACEALETLPEETLQECSENLQSWFKEWVIRGWLIQI